jgi:hypothetical protein
MRATLRFAWSVAMAALLLAFTDCHRISSAEAPPPRSGLEDATRSASTPSVPPVPPATLTASDGTGLALAKLTGRAVIEGPLAFTELRLAFVNPQPRALEGTFKIALPQGASISRFAMRIGEQWQEGEVVERQRARIAYEDFLHRKRDPALLEQSAGNEFGARVFPIPANATKEILVSYAEELRGTAPYVLRLRGLARLGAIDVTVSASATHAPLAALRETDWVPAADLVVDRAILARGEGLRSGELVLAPVRPLVVPHPEPLGATVVLFDTSASRALGYEEQVRVLEALAGKLADSTRDATWTVACFDQSVTEVYSGPLRGLAGAIDAIRARAPLGASDVARALAWAGRRAQETGAKRVLLVSDGVATAGEVDRASLVATARAMRPAGVERIDALAVGGIRDDAILFAIATAGLGHDGVVVGADEGPDVIARRLGEQTRSGLLVQVEGARWWYPATIDAAQAGDEFLVYAEVADPTAVSISVGDAPHIALNLRSVERPLIERAWAQAKIASLLDRDDAKSDKTAIRAQVVELSRAHRVLSPYTALLVLETEDDYARFRIDRNSLADILTVQGSRVALSHRKDAVLVPSVDRRAEKEAAQFGLIGLASSPADVRFPEDDKPVSGNSLGERIGDSFGAGGLGLSGVGEGGGGRGQGIGLGNFSQTDHAAGIGNGLGRLSAGHSVAAPRIREGATSVSGRLPPEVIQRIVRQNFGRFRLCYEHGMRSRPDLRGRVVVRFIIDPSGAVSMTADSGSDLPDQGVVQCVTRAFGNLSFPATDAPVTVVYPIVFAPGEGPSSDAQSGPQTLAPLRPPAPPPAPSPPPADEFGASPYAGAFADAMRALDAHDTAGALKLAWSARARNPGDVMALVALGEALEASGDPVTAARAYGSIIDLFPSRADMRRMAGERLERVSARSLASLGPAGDRVPARSLAPLGPPGERVSARSVASLSNGAALDLAVDTYAKAVADRPDHPSSHRLLAFARLKQHDYERAFDAALAGLAYRYPDGRFRGVDQVLREDVGLIGAAWAAAEPSRRDTIEARVRGAGGIVENGASLRFVLNWETDANDVDLHVRDVAGDHAFFAHPSLASGGRLYADVTTGYGPECFTVRLPKGQRSSKYTLQVHYYSRGPMGYGMGKVEIIDHDGHGGIRFEERPFVVMNEQAFVELGTY